ncbi:MAG: hypothetical protein ACLQU2_31335 [Candidatus Binataceae bacterium]
MAELNIKVNAPAMPISTEFVRFCKAVEHFYYVLVLTTQSDAGKAHEAWSGWLAAGLNPAVRLTPPVDKVDKLALDSRPGVKGFEVTVRSANPQALGRLGALIEELDATRKALNVRTDEQMRLAALRENRIVAELLVQPMQNSLARAQITPEGAKSFLIMIERRLLAVTAPDITSVAIAVG